MSSKLKQLAARFSDGGWALAEQGSQSATNFLTVALIGKMVNLETLAVYQMGRFLILLIAGFQNSLISFPYTITYREKKLVEVSRFAGNQLRLSLMLAALAVPVLAIGLLFPMDPSARSMLFALLLAVPMYLLREFFRRHDFAQLRTRTTFLLSAVTSLIQITGILILWKFERLTAANVFLVIATACCTTTVVWWLLRRSEFSFRSTKGSACPVRVTARENWKIGKWIFSTQAVGDLFLTAVQWSLGSTLVGGMFAACFQIVSLCNPVVMGLANLLPPRFALVFSESGRSELMVSIRNFNKSFVVIVGLLAIGLVAFCEPLLALVSKEAVTQPYHLTLVLALMMLVQAMGLPAFHGLNAIQQPADAFWPRLIGVSIAILFCALVGGRDSAISAAYTLLIANAVISFLTYWRVKSELELKP